MKTGHWFSKTEWLRANNRGTASRVERDANWDSDVHFANRAFLAKRGVLFPYNPGNLRSIFDYLEKTQRYDVFRLNGIPQVTVVDLPPERLSQPADTPPGDVLRQGGQGAKILSYRNTRVEIQIDDARPAERTLILFDSYARGWKATLDGKPVRVEQVLGAWRGVRLGPDFRQGVLVMEFKPWAFPVGAAMSLGGLAAACLATAIAWGRRRRLAQSGF